MKEQQKHEMVLEITHPTGAEEWYCPTCGRRLLLSWPPAYKKIILDAGNEPAFPPTMTGELIASVKKIILDAGNELASHSGGKGGLRVGQIQKTEADDSALPSQIRSSIEKILRDLHFDDPPSEASPDS